MKWGRVMSSCLELSLSRSGILTTPVFFLCCATVLIPPTMNLAEILASCLPVSSPPSAAEGLTGVLSPSKVPDPTVTAPPAAVPTASSGYLVATKMFLSVASALSLVVMAI